MSEEKKQKEELLGIISKLYKEEEREEGLKMLSELVCEEKIRAEYLNNSFGIITILQQEIISFYKHLYPTDLKDNKEEIRLCNTLTILRSILSIEDYSHLLIESHILYFLAPLIESEFSNIRKICFAVLFEISQKSIENICKCMIFQGLMISCFSVYKYVDENEKKSILIILFNILKKGLMNYLMNFNANPTINNFRNHFISFLKEEERKKKESTLNDLWKEVYSLSRDSFNYNQVMDDGIR